MNLIQPDMFDKYSIRITAETAETLLALVKGLDFHKMNVGEVLALNQLWAQLEEVAESKEAIDGR